MIHDDDDDDDDDDDEEDRFVSLFLRRDRESRPLVSVKYQTVALFHHILLLSAYRLGRRAAPSRVNDHTRARVSTFQRVSTRFNALQRVSTRGARSTRGDSLREG